MIQPTCAPEHGVHVLTDVVNMVCDCGAINFSSSIPSPPVVKEGMKPIEVFDLMLEKAETALRVTFMESGRDWDQQVYDGLLKPVLGIGIAVTSEHYAQYPEHLAIAGKPICAVCLEPVQSWQVGVDPARDDDNDVAKVAWPCGHYQP